MSSSLFTHQQIFRLKRTTLEKRIQAYFTDTRDEKLTIKYLVALQIRDRLNEEDFSFMLKDLVRQILLETKSTRTLRQHFLKFKAYFSKKEWETVKARLFPAKTYTDQEPAELQDQSDRTRPQSFAIP